MLRDPEGSRDPRHSSQVRRSGLCSPRPSRPPSSRLLPRKNADSIGFDKGLDNVFVHSAWHSVRRLHGAAWLGVCGSCGMFQSQSSLAVGACYIVHGFRSFRSCLGFGMITVNLLPPSLLILAYPYVPNAAAGKGPILHA